MTRFACAALVLAGCSVISSTDDERLEPRGAIDAATDTGVDAADGAFPEAMVPDALVDAPLDSALPDTGPPAMPDGVTCQPGACAVGEACCVQEIIPSFCIDPSRIRCICPTAQCATVECDGANDCARGERCCGEVQREQSFVSEVRCRASCDGGGGSRFEVCPGPEGARCAGSGVCRSSPYLPSGMGACVAE